MSGLLLSDSDVAELVAIDESMMTDTATVRRYTSVPDGSGGTTDTFANAGTAKCRINIAGNSPREGAVAGELQNSTNFMLHFPTGTDVRNKDQILVGTRTFEVDKALSHTWQTSLRVMATEIT
jgi:hypothetical protein